MIPAVTGDASNGTAARVGRMATGQRLGGFIYGTIVVLSVIVGGARAFPHEPGRIALAALVTAVIFWLAHVYAHALAQSVGTGQHLTVSEVRRIGRREASLIEAAVPPIAALLLGALGIVSEQVALWLAFALGLVVLGAQGVLFARAERLGAAATIAVVALNLALGAVLVGLKLLVSH